MRNLEDILLAIEKNREIARELDIPELKRDEYLNKANDVVHKFLNSVNEAKAYQQNQPNTEKLTINNKPTDFEEVLALFDSEVLRNGINAASGGHLGYIPGGGIYASALGDYLAAVSNAYSGMYYASPGAVEMEHSCLNWLKSVFEFPENAVGNLTSGGSIANLIALTAARDKYKIKNEAVKNAVIYLSEQVHHCIQKSLRIIGLEDVTINKLQIDKTGKIVNSDLVKKIETDRANGKNPFMVIASAGTTDVGVVDDLDTLGEIARTNDLWFHVDAAYGGFFILCEEKKTLFNGIGKADSLVVDPHKGMFLPYGIGAVLVNDKEAVFHSNHYTANYMQDALESMNPVNPADVSPELTKHFRAMRMWLPLKIHGIKPFIACLNEKIALTHYFRLKLEELGFEIGPKPDLTVSYFWYPAKKENEFNKKLLSFIHNDGDVFFSSTILKEKFVIRMAILSFRTTKDTIDKALKMIEKGLAITQD